jgi:hypothetical protein
VAATTDWCFVTLGLAIASILAIWSHHNHRVTATLESH